MANFELLRFGQNFTGYVYVSMIMPNKKKKEFRGKKFFIVDLVRENHQILG